MTTQHETENKDELEVKSLVKEQANRVSEQIQEIKSQAKAEAVQEIETGKLAEISKEFAEQKQRSDQLEAAIHRMGNGSDESKNSKFEIEQKSKFENFLRKGGNGALEILEKKDLRTDSDPDGGYVVRPQFSTRISQRMFESSPIRQYATVERIGTSSFVVTVDDEEAGASWVGQGSLGSNKSTPRLRQVTIPVHKMATKPEITTELLQDSILNLEQWLQNKVADKFSRAENQAFISGDGAGKPRGILSYPAWTSNNYEFGKIQQIKSGAANALTVDGLIALQNALKEPYQTNAVWLMKRSTFGEILKLKGTEQYHFLGLQPVDRQGVIVQTLLGRPVVFADDMQAVGANNLAIAYGDFGAGYTIVDNGSLDVIRDPYTSDGNVVFKTHKRMGGGVVNFESIKILKIAA